MNSSGVPRAYGEPVLSASIRAAPEDFVVDEIDAFPASGSGEHLLLTVEKRGMNTAFAAKRIAQWAGVAESAIGYAGLKDRHALTRQRFSVWLPKKSAPDPEGLKSSDLRVLDAAWHARKLPRGALAGNRFVLMLRDVDGVGDAIDARLERIAGSGVPNYFGEQRFGREGGNVANALAMFSGRRFSREQRSLLLSAARSELFNRVLSARVRQGSWNHGLDGEVWMLAGSRSVFGPEPTTDTLIERLRVFDIHPSGPLWGEGALRTQGDCAALEAWALGEGDGPALQRGLEAARLRQERRALRQQVADLQWMRRDATTLELRFSLPPGSYATALLHELGSVSDASS